MPVKINVILLRFPQANLCLAKIIVLDFTGLCFDAIVRQDRVTSEKAEASVTESPENKGIRVERYSQILLCRQNSSLPLEPQILYCRQNSSLS